MAKTLLEQWLQQTRHDVGTTERALEQSKTIDATLKAHTGNEEHRSTDTLEDDDSTSSKLHANIAILHPRSEDVPRFKRLNSLLLPIPYPESFYKEVQTDPVAQALTLLAFWRDNAAAADEDQARQGQLVGAARCRVLSNAGSRPMLYLSTLVVLSPYRGLGIASHMLDMLIRSGVEQHGVATIGAHVWDNNIEAIEWYHKRGFRETGHEPNYYRKLEPSGAKVLSRGLSVLDLACR